MSSNIYTNTGIVEASWNSRGLILHNGINKSLIRQDNGILWAAVREAHVNKYINIYKSTDNGFTWDRMWSGTYSSGTYKTGITGLNINGPVMHLTINENRGILQLFHSYYDTFAGGYGFENFYFTINSDGTITKGSNLAFTVDQDDLFFDVSYNDDIVNISYVSYSSLIVRSYRHTFPTTADGTHTATGNTYFNLLSTYSKPNNTMHIAILRDNTSNYHLEYILYNRINGTFSTPVVISQTPITTINDINIAEDGYGTLCVYWNQLSTDDLDAYSYYSLSYDNGNTWSTPALIPTTFGQYDFVDQATMQTASRTVLMSGLQGFILSYVRNINNYAQTYVRLLTSDTGLTNSYNLGDEKIVGLKNNTHTIGLRFFLPASSSLLNLNNPGEIRVAFSQGQSTTNYQVDKEPSYFGQKLLNDDAYPEEFIVEFEQDFAIDNELLFTFNLLGGTSDNIDYYNEGLIGNITKKYESAFDRMGTSIYIEKYEPIQESQLSDKSGYSLEDSIYIKAFVDEINYSYPISTGNDSFKDYIERDTRSVHIPPYLHLSRTFLINNGNYLKRTVWLMTYAGNQYELSQLVPKFVDNQIVYYTVNAYVVGPSRNPFTRIILPSET